jgi:hypothetical protein
MLTISGEQMLRMHSAMLKSADAAMLSWLRDHCPTEMSVLAEAEQQELPKIARETAMTFGLSSDDCVRRFAAAMLRHGAGFHEMPWALEILYRGDFSPEAKVEALERRAARSQ